MKPATIYTRRQLQTDLEHFALLRLVQNALVVRVVHRLDLLIIFELNARIKSVQDEQVPPQQQC